MGQNNNNNRQACTVWRAEKNATLYVKTPNSLLYCANEVKNDRNDGLTIYPWSCIRRRRTVSPTASRRDVTSSQVPVELTVVGGGEDPEVSFHFRRKKRGPLSSINHTVQIQNRTVLFIRRLSAIGRCLIWICVEATGDPVMARSLGRVQCW